jgi:hypothetical protein
MIFILRIDVYISGCWDCVLLLLSFLSSLVTCMMFSELNEFLHISLMRSIVSVLEASLDKENGVYFWIVRVTFLELNLELAILDSLRHILVLIIIKQILLH